MCFFTWGINCYSQSNTSAIKKVINLCKQRKLSLMYCVCRRNQFKIIRVCVLAKMRSLVLCKNKVSIPGEKICKEIGFSFLCDGIKG